MSARPCSFERDIVINVTVITGLLDFNANDLQALENRLGQFRQRNFKLGLTGALLISNGGAVLVLEGAAGAIVKAHTYISANHSNSNVHRLAESVCLKRRFPGWPLAYVGPSRWVHRALENHELADMVSESPAEAEFLIDLVLAFVGDGS